jgi:hypothetical protein
MEDFFPVYNPMGGRNFSIPISNREILHMESRIGAPFPSLLPPAIDVADLRPLQLLVPPVSRSVPSSDLYLPRRSCLCLASHNNLPCLLVRSLPFLCSQAGPPTTLPYPSRHRLDSRSPPVSVIPCQGCT